MSRNVQLRWFLVLWLILGVVGVWVIKKNSNVPAPVPVPCHPITFIAQAGWFSLCSDGGNVFHQEQTNWGHNLVQIVPPKVRGSHVYWIGWKNVSAGEGELYDWDGSRTVVKSLPFEDSPFNMQILPGGGGNDVYIADANRGKICAVGGWCANLASSDSVLALEEEETAKRLIVVEYGYVSAYSTTTGRLLWRDSFPKEAFLSIDEGKFALEEAEAGETIMLMLTRDGLYGIAAANGRVQWHTPADFWSVEGSFIVGGIAVIHGSTQIDLFETTSGRLLGTWRGDTVGFDPEERQIVLASYSDGKTLLWGGVVGDKWSWSLVVGGKQTIEQVANNVVVVGNADGLGAVRVGAHKLLWEHAADGCTFPTVILDRIWCLEGGEVVGYDVNTGKEEVSMTSPYGDVLQMLN